MRLAAACALSIASLTCVSQDSDGRRAVRLRVCDPETGRLQTGLVRVRNASSGTVPLDGLLCRGTGLDPAHAARGWYVLPGEADVRLPRERLTVEAVVGLETETARAELGPSGEGPGEVTLGPRRFSRVADRGWRGANTHLHLKQIPREEAERYLGLVPRADALDALFVSYLERADADREYVSNGLSVADLRRLSQASGVLLGNGEEHRHNFAKAGEAPGQSFGGEGYGHVMFLNITKLVRPVSIGPGIMKAGTDGIPLRHGIDEARRDGATILWCHNTFGLEDVPDWVEGRPHAQNIFDGDPATHGSYKDTFYRYLNAGLRVPFSTGTDWFVYDFSRVYALAPTMKTTRDWLEALEKGRTFITNGPLLEFRVNGEGPGGTARLEGPGRVKVAARAVGRVDFRRLELVRNGEVVLASDSRRDEGHYVADFAIDLETTGPCWLAARVPPPPLEGEPASGFPASELGGPIFAHTSAVGVEVAGRRFFDREAAKGLLEEVKRARETVEKRAIFADDHERDHVLEVYSAASTVLERMLR